ncbi:MAG TPA: hypothetical protein DSN98_08770 [Thermoplasmata archaeon]|jgi:photosystem II stability/assembly factor-like uncharacterized protein|nr:MAG TPA: hypothetical protein DSN98_08770 [Thermoplasmata archaeon]
MKLLNRTKMLIKASVVLAIALAFVMPVTAASSKTTVATILPQEPKNIFRNAEWIQQATNFPDASRGIDYISCVDENIVWAVGYDGISPTSPCQDFTKTIDGGTTWSPGLITAADGLKSCMIFALDADKAWVPMYAASGGVQGIYYTSDGGSTWVRQPTALFSDPASFPDCVHFWDANVGWCMGDPIGGYFEIYTTTDGGTTWTRIPQADIPNPLSGEWGVVGYYDVIGDTIWFGTNVGRVYKSIDKGYHWTVAQTTLTAYIKPTFKDADHGLVIDLNAAANALLAETSDGGATWATVSYSGTCYDTDMIYIPGTENMYISTGAATAKSGASYSLDGGHSWTDYAEQVGLQMMNLDFVAGKIGWAGAFNDAPEGGIWKHMPSETPKPALTISIVGGKGFTVTVTNIGEANATGVTCAITLEGGLFIKPKDFSGSQANLGVGQNFTIPGAPKGIGLGFITPIPTIKISVNCTEGIGATKSVPAKIFFSKITLQ